MKLTVIAFLLGTASMFGTTMQVFTGGPTAPQDITDNAGNSVTGAGFAAIGTWLGTPISGVTDPATLAARFTIGAYQPDPSAPLETYSFLANSADGFNVTNVTKASITAAGDIGKKIGVVIWKGPDADNLLTATEAIVYELDQTYDDAATPTAVNYLDGAGTLMYGVSNTQMLALVPEPSSVLLLGLGSLGFLVRRKR